MERNIGILIGFLEAHNASAQVMQAAQDIFTLCKGVHEGVNHRTEAKPDLRSEEISGLIDQYLNDNNWGYNSCEVRAKNILKLYDIKTVEDLYKFSEKLGIYRSLIRTPNCGGKTVRLIIESIKHGGYAIEKKD